MQDDSISILKNIYSRLKNSSLDPDKDPIKKIHNTLDFISVITEMKPVFYYGDEDVHPKAMELFITLAKENTLKVKLTSCLRNYNFIENIKSIPKPILLQYISYRKEIDNNTTGLWVMKDPALDSDINELFKTGSDFGFLLGYPACCVEYNKVILAKIHEYFLNYYITHFNEKDPERLIELIDSPDIPQPDASVVNRLNYKDRLNKYPYISHTPCPNCLSTTNSLSAKLDQKRKQLAKILDTGIDHFLQEFIHHYNQFNP